MLIQGSVGPQNASSLAAGTNPTVRQGQLGDVIVSELHGRYYETAYRKALFTGYNTAGTVTTVGLATTYTGFVLANPVQSQVNLVINKVGLSFTVAFAAAAAVGIMTGQSFTAFSGVATNAAVKSAFVGAPAGSGVCYSGATLPATPTIHTILYTGLTGAITTTPGFPSLFDLEGSIILPPGGFAAVYTSTVSGAASLFASMTWEEVPL
jgi:hypothetical protein